MAFLFSPSYPEQTASEVDGKEFDYVIVGGGTAGCVLASRLSEDPSVSVLLISRGRVKENWFFEIPLVTQMMQRNSPQSVALEGEMDGTWDGARPHVYTSQGLGGASRVNGLMLTRGTPSTYNRWSELGNDEWAFDKCEPYFRKMEDTSLLSKTYRSKWRGDSGPPVVRHMPSVLGVDNFWDATAEDVGLPVGADLNNPESPAMGIFNIDVMVDKDSMRLSSQKAYLPRKLALERRGRLVICTGAAATKLEVDEDGKNVLGVHLLDVRSTKVTRACYVKAKREVIVACGALFSPQLLMLSGIGSRKELETHRIPVVRDLSGVGQNLKDHVSFGLSFEVKPTDSNHALMRPFFVLWHFIVFLIWRTGIFASTTTKQCIWVRSDAIDDDTMQVMPQDAIGRDNMDAHDTRNTPDIEIILTAAALDDEWTRGTGYYGLYTTLTQPASRGRISLTSSDPLALPLLHHPCIDPAADGDWGAARKAARFAMHLTERFRTKGYDFSTVWHRAPGMTPGSTAGSWRDATDDEIDAFVKKRFRSTLHVTSSCRMGAEAAGGVVGQDLRVHGFENLRVADASVFPELTCAHTVAPTYMVAERAADMIKETWTS
ncbi:choline dehydrogenase, partial [Plectosphaerella plurivora]